MTQNPSFLYGPSFPGDYGPNDLIVFSENGVILRGEVIQCCAPMTLPSGTRLGVHCIVDCGDGFVHVVPMSRVTHLHRSNGEPTF